MCDAIFTSTAENEEFEIALLWYFTERSCYLGFCFHFMEMQLEVFSPLPAFQRFLCEDLTAPQSSVKTSVRARQDTPVAWGELTGQNEKYHRQDPQCCITCVTPLCSRWPFLKLACGRKLGPDLSLCIDHNNVNVYTHRAELHSTGLGNEQVLLFKIFIKIPLKILVANTYHKWYYSYCRLSAFLFYRTLSNVAWDSNEVMR